jgi:hypothetical protein
MKKAPAAILAASIVALTGCAAAPSPVTTVTVVPVIAAPDSTPSVEPRNPVELIKLIDGCQTEEDAELGKTAIDGSRYAECHWNDNSDSGGTEVVLYTYPGDAKELSTHSLLTPDDSHRVIVGPDFVVSITGDWSKGGYSKHLTKEKLKAIADKVGGEVATG